MSNKKAETQKRLKQQAKSRSNRRHNEADIAYLRKRWVGNPTITKANRNVKALEHMLTPEYLDKFKDRDPEFIRVMMDKELDIRKILLDDCHKRIKQLLPAQKSVDINLAAEIDSTIEIVIKRED